MPYTYVGKGTVILGIKNKRVEELQPGDKVLGFYIGFGTKQHVESKVKSIRRVGNATCKMVGSKVDYALIADGQKTVGPNFRPIDINEVVYNVGRLKPRPFKVHKVIDNVEVYEIILEDSDVVPLLTAYMFVAYSDKPINFQGGLSGKEDFKEQSEKSNKQSTERSTESESEVKQEEKEQPKRRKKRKSKRNKEE